MVLLRQYLWALVILGMIFVSVVISLIFLLVNKCISRKRSLNHLKINCVVSGAQSYENLSDEHDYEECADQKPDSVKLEAETQILRPPPPGTDPDQDPKMKSGLSVAQSYENLAEEQDYEESTEQLPDYVKLEEEVQLLGPAPLYSDPHPHRSSGLCGAQSYQNLAEEQDYEESTDQQPDYSYENLAEEQDYEESTDQQPDYVMPEGGAEVLPPPPADPEADCSSSEDYDDIGGGEEEEEEEEEDYDDIA
ncbi:unnamed protein product [Menidia menidia]|uniref:(Atlantic silverside) hypothetical protein n=1 Tax=Menidia menidia TaxID=238744 RepID=A0A8S4AMA4_9TELE|nr:unnamed protein product [Menidia menidia]